MSEQSMRERILDVATDLFSARGADGTPLQGIADAVGVSKPTVVYHFGSKQNLRVCVLRRVLDHWRDRLPQMMSEATSGGPGVETLLTALFGFFRDQPARARLLQRELLSPDTVLPALLREHLQPWTQLLTQALRLGQAQGVVRPSVDPEAFVVLVVHTAIATISVGHQAGALLRPEPTVDQQLETLISVAQAGLLPLNVPHLQEA